MRYQRPLVILISLFLFGVCFTSCKKDNTDDTDDIENSDILKQGSGFKVAARLKDVISKPEGTITFFKTLDFSVTPNNRLHWFYRCDFYGSPPPKGYFRTSFDLATGDTTSATLQVDENIYKDAKYQAGTNVLYQSIGGIGSNIQLTGDVTFDTQRGGAGGMEIAYNGDYMNSGLWLNGVDGLGQQRYQLYANNWHNGVYHGFFFERRAALNDPDQLWIGSKAEVVDNNGTMVIFAYKHNVLYAIDETDQVIDSISLPEIPWVGGEFISTMRLRTALDESKVIIALDFRDAASTLSLNTIVYQKQTRTLSAVVVNNMATDYTGNHWDADDDGSAYYLSGLNGALKLNKATTGGVTQIGTSDFLQQGNVPAGAYIRNNHVYIPTDNFAILEPK